MTEGPNNLDEAVGRTIARRRNAHPLTQEEMAYTLSTSAGRVRNFEQGRQRIPLSYVWECAGVFNCEVTDIFAEAAQLLRARGIVPTPPKPNPTLGDIGRSLGF
ncbi:helix-turn-helix domain-containing protein [Nocardia sp. NPDC060249]|uniref:helix-turn-helix domain-containing protein n=1 Tax=Nocardia sp. NPDC060249 TaxID=3347082 RepID=UPI00364DA796